MSHYTIIVHADKPIKTFKEIFEGFFPEAALHFEDKKTLFITLSQTEEPQNPIDLYHLLLSDLELSLTFVSLPLISDQLLSPQSIADSLPKLKPDYYEYEAFLIALLKHNGALSSELKEKLSSLCNPTLITNMIALAQNNMNISITASSLYIHRNTLIYRIDSIKDKTGIDVRKFDGLMIFYWLFH